MRRIFTAIKIKPNDKLKGAMEDFRHQLKHENIKWVDPQNIHITLKFFGETPGKEIPDIINTLREASLASNLFKANITGCGTFGSPRFPRVIWMGLDNTGNLEKLYDNFNRDLSEKGYLPDKRGFSPHLTIGRVKHIKDLYSLDALISKYADELFMTYSVSEFQLFESILRKEGPVYKVVENFKLI